MDSPEEILRSNLDIASFLSRGRYPLFPPLLLLDLDYKRGDFPLKSPNSGVPLKGACRGLAKGIFPWAHSRRLGSPPYACPAGSAARPASFPSSQDRHNCESTVVRTDRVAEERLTVTGGHQTRSVRSTRRRPQWSQAGQLRTGSAVAAC
jgi:hypothetical protein